MQILIQNQPLEKMDFQAVLFDLDGTLVYGTFVDGEDEPIPNVFEGISYTYAVKVGAIIIKVQGTNVGVIGRPGALPIQVVLIESAE